MIGRSSIEIDRIVKFGQFKHAQFLSLYIGGEFSQKTSDNSNLSETFPHNNKKKKARKKWEKPGKQVSVPLLSHVCDVDPNQEWIGKPSWSLGPYNLESVFCGWFHESRYPSSISVVSPRFYLHFVFFLPYMLFVKKVLCEMILGHGG